MQNINDYSVQELIKFLDYGLESRLFRSNTANTRKTAINKILFDNDKLTSQERSDVRKIDVERIFAENLYPDNLNSASIRTYKSRLLSSIKDFKNWKRDPVHFKSKQYVKHNLKVVNSAIDRTENNTLSQDIIIPIRDCKILVRICNVPFNLTTEEAQKINNVIYAYFEECR